MKKRGIILPLFFPLLEGVPLVTDDCRLECAFVLIVVRLWSFTNFFHLFHPGLEELLKDLHPF